MNKQSTAARNIFTNIFNKSEDQPEAKTNHRSGHVHGVPVEPPKIYSYAKKTDFEHVIYLTTDVGEIEDHLQSIEAIRSAPEGEEIRLIINSPGGYVTTMLAFMDAIKETKATIIGHAQGQISSAATFIWLSCHKHTVADFTTAMFHNYQGGMWGDGANIHAKAKYERDWSLDLMYGVYGGFLTAEELKTISNGGELYLGYQDLKSRLPDYYEYKNNQVLEKCQCQDCQMYKAQKEALERGYSDLTLSSGKKVRLGLKGDGVAKKYVKDLTLEEWQEVAAILNLETSPLMTKAIIHDLVNSTINKDIEQG